ncbi:MAG: hypothetical protein WAX07_05685 [Candidatus Altiarchaeia archaeon]
MKTTDRFLQLYLTKREKEFGYKDLMEAFKVSANNAKVILSRMSSSGMARRTGRDRYVLLDPLSYMIRSSYGRNVVKYMEDVYAKSYYFSGPSALSFYGLVSSGEYYISVEDANAAEAYSKALQMDVKAIKKAVKEENYKREVFEGKEANVARPEVALSETLLLGDDIVQFYGIPAVGEYLERGNDPKKLVSAAKDAGTGEYMEKILKVYKDRGYRVSIMPKSRPNKKEEEFISGGINV